MYIKCIYLEGMPQYIIYSSHVYKKLIHTLEKGQNKSKVVKFFLKFVDCSDPLTCFSSAQNVT